MAQLIFFVTILISSSLYASSLKAPNVSGGFYSADPKELSLHIDSFINQAEQKVLDSKIQAMIAPHAGYIYSGSVAAYGYKAASKNKYSTVVILAPSHFFSFEGIAVWQRGGFRTPLGVLDVDEQFTSQLLLRDRQFQAREDVFEKEHALEVQLPFIQRALGQVKLVAVLMGTPDPGTCQKLAVALNEIVGSREDVLVLASSDMSHYFPYEKANEMDKAALEAISQLDVQKFWEGCLIKGQMEMCGVAPVTTVLLYAKLRALSPQILKHANSGDTQGDRSKVVGYSSVVFYKQDQDEKLKGDQQKELISMARKTMEAFVKTGEKLDLGTKDPRLLKSQGAFVTLTKHGQLRGCVGNIIADKSLWDTVKEMAIASASQDSRFPPVSKEELPEIDLEISVLSVPQRILDDSSIILGRDGVIVSDGGVHQGIFLPQVAQETHWSKQEFLNELCTQKAGLPAECWKEKKNSLWTFQAEVFGR